MNVLGRLLLLAVSLPPWVVAGVVGEAERLPSPPAKGSYAVLISAGSDRQAGWAKAADALVAKHDAVRVVVRDGAWETALPTLRRLRPRYVCLVARPEEAGRDTVVRLHRMLRRMDEDPYQDAIWAVLTGYDAADALRIAEREAPLDISSGFSSMGSGLAERLGAGFGSMEVKPGEFRRLNAAGEVETVVVSPDSAEILAESFRTTPVEVMWTSGHATERDWQIAFNLPGGEVRSERGQLYTRNSKGQRFDFTTPNPKVYLPMGNCLIGHVDGPEALALAWMHSGGVHQMMGYTVVTFYGYMGWGVNAYFDAQGMSLSEAVNANRQAALYKLRHDFPEAADIDFAGYEVSDIQRNARLFGIQGRDLAGLLWDRDTLAFYGDPAWTARMPAKDRGWTLSQTSEPLEGGARACWTLRVETTRNGDWGERPLVIYFPDRLADIRDLAVSGLEQALLLDDMALLPVEGSFAAGEVVELSWTAAREEAPSTRGVTVRLDGLPPNVEKEIGAWRTQREQLRRVLIASGERAGAWWDAAQSMEGEGRVHFVLLLAAMTGDEARTVPIEGLRAHVLTQMEAWQRAPWADWIGRFRAREGLMAFRNLDEAWDGWAPRLREIALPLVEGAATPSEAALRLNEKLFPALGVAYHATKRPKANQNVAESIEAGYASCTGLSILLANACRSVGVPARVVGIPRWPDGQGNHTWVEIWDRGVWFPMGAAEPAGLGEAWFLKAASKAVARHPEHRIYASSLLRGSDAFLLPWNPLNREARALDVTHAYVEGRVGTAKDLPLAEALWSGNAEGVSAALAAGANPNLDMDDLQGPPQTALLWALSRGHKEAALLLREAGAKVPEVQFAAARDLVRDTLLKGDAAPADILIAAGFDPAWVDPEGNTLLHAFLQRNGKEEALPALLEKGLPVNAKNRAGETALDLAVRYGRLKAVAYMREAGAEPWAGQGAETLYAALRRGIPEVVEAMLAADTPRLTPEEASRMLPICFYFTRVHAAAAAKMLAWGADPQTRKADGVLAGSPSFPTAERYAKAPPGPALYDVARRGGHMELAAAFEDKASAVNQLDAEGDTPLIAAVKRGDAAEVDRLLAAGAWVERPSPRSGLTPLLAAVASRQVALVERLLKESASLEVRDREGNGAMDMAISQNNLPLAELLCANGVDPAAKKGAHPSPMEYARMKGADEILRMFERLAQKEELFQWTEDVAAAKAQAKADGVPVGLFFTGSDWCGACKSLKDEVLDTAAFSQRFGGRLVPVELDYPRRAKQDEALKKQNQEQLDLYFPDGRRGYPTWILLSPDGREVTRIVGYRQGAPRDWMDQFEAAVNAASQAKNP